MRVTKFERFFYLLIIIVLFSLILYKKNNVPMNKSNSQAYQLFSFIGFNHEGEKKIIQFTAYSSQYFIFCIISTECHHCREFFTKFNKFFEENKIIGNTQLVFLTESSENFNSNTSFPVLKISRDDIIQFGFNTPTIFAVNGQGKVLFNHSGYYAGLFRDALETITIDKNRGN